VDVRDITRWFAATLATERRNAIGVAVAGVAGGLFAYLLTFAFTYGAIFFISLTVLHWSLGVCLGITLALMVALFFGNLTTAREYLESYSFTTGTASDKVVTFYVPQVGLASTVNPLAPDSAHSYLKMFVSVLYTGPRLLMGAVHNLRRAKRLATIDVDGCAGILSFLLEREKRASLVEIAAAFPGRSLEALFPQLAELQGVLFLKSEPPGLSLSTDLRREILSSARG
jgi:hypothetical protein